MEESEAEIVGMMIKPLVTGSSFSCFIEFKIASILSLKLETLSVDESLEE